MAGHPEPDLPLDGKKLSPRAEGAVAAIYLASCLGLAIVFLFVWAPAGGVPVVAIFIAVCVPLLLTIVRRMRWPSSDQRGFAESVAANVLALCLVWVEPRIWVGVVVLTALLSAANMATAGLRGAVGALAISGVVLFVQALTLDTDAPLGALGILIAAPAVFAGLESKRLVRQRRSYAVLYLRHGLIAAKFERANHTSGAVVTDINPAALAMFDTARSDFVGRQLFDVLPWMDEPEIASALSTMQAGQKKQRRRLLLDDGRVLDVDISALPKNEVAFTFTDVTGQVAAEQTIRQQAEVDALTGLSNRAVLVSALNERLGDDRRRVRPFALLMIDLNRFKEINDTFGHHVGDMALTQIAAQLKNAARPTDLVARVGGDEFAVIVEQPDDATTALDIATRFAMACEEPVLVGGMRVVTGASIGVALAPEDGRDTETVMRRADTAMYEAKRSGDRVRAFANAYAHRDRDRLALSSQIDVAFAKSEFFMLAQPKINLRTGVVTGVELLARWRHPERGLIEPDDFIDLVELAGRSSDLARIAVRAGVAGLALVDVSEVGTTPHVAVNLSPRDFADASLPDFIEGLLNEHDVAPDQLFLEVTENQVFDQLDGVESFLEALLKLGVRLSIDDFGTGHSNLLRLNYLPVAEIKLDKYFTDQLITAPEDAVMVRSVVELGHNLGLRVTAEGVEDRHQADILRRLGCDHAQGFLWAKPMPVDQALALIGSKIG